MDKNPNARDKFERTVSDVVQGGWAFLTGAGRAATAGLVKYPAGVALAASRKLAGAHPTTWSEDFKDAQDAFEKTADEHPVMNVAGQVAGSFVPGGAISKVATAAKVGARKLVVPALEAGQEATKLSPLAVKTIGAVTEVAGNSALGATNAFSEGNDVGWGAAFGGAAGGLGLGLSAGLKATARHAPKLLLKAPGVTEAIETTIAKRTGQKAEFGISPLDRASVRDIKSMVEDGATLEEIIQKNPSLWRGLSVDAKNIIKTTLADTLKGGIAYGTTKFGARTFGMDDTQSDTLALAAGAAAGSSHIVPALSKVASKIVTPAAASLILPGLMKGVRPPIGAVLKLSGENDTPLSFEMVKTLTTPVDKMSSNISAGISTASGENAPKEWQPSSMVLAEDQTPSEAPKGKPIKKPIKKEWQPSSMVLAEDQTPETPKGKPIKKEWQPSSMVLAEDQTPETPKGKPIKKEWQPSSMVLAE